MKFYYQLVEWVEQSRYAWLLNTDAFRYLIAGGTAFLVMILVLTFLIEIFNVNDVLAAAMGFLCAIPVNYSLQKKFVFRSQAPVGKSFVIYCAVTAATMVLNVELFYLIIKYSGLHYIVSQGITIMIIVVLNYFVNRHFTFAHVEK